MPDPRHSPVRIGGPSQGAPFAPGLGARATILGPVAAHIAFVIELTLVPLLLPAMRSQFELSLSELAWVFNAYSVAVALGVLVGGLFGDTFKTTKVFGYGVFAFLGGSVLLAASTNAEMLIIGRILQGFGAGVFSPLIPVLLTRSAPDKPGRVLILWGSLAGYVAAFAPLIYSGVLGSEGWNLAFGFIAAIAGLSLLVLNWSPATGKPEVMQREKPKYLAIFQARDLWLTLAYVFFTYGAITYFLFRLPLWLSETGAETTSIGFVLSTFWLTFSGLSALLRNKVDQHHVQTIMLAAPLLIAAGLLTSYNANTVLLVGSAILVGAGLACSNAPSTQLILRHAPKGLSAVSTSLDITLARFGGIAAVAVLAETGVSVAGPVICASCLVAAFCTIAIRKQAPQSA
ncbi:MFS transporter [uncultured Tateyamaria sp.]|uniref:MFS transporter n=1 Tax=uncultured Tateyamaria sp. TaxID=455651 RepID=UPI00261F6D9C|nr:MFS transporter [uncultured Tateyamaria sp.]